MKEKPATYHVVPNKDGGWDVVKGGAAKSSGHFKLKQDAIEEAKKLAGVTCEVYLHGKDGKICKMISRGQHEREI